MPGHLCIRAWERNRFLEALNMQMQMCSSMDVQSVARCPDGWKEPCFNYPVVRCQVLNYWCLLFSLSPLLLPPSPSPRAVLLFVYRNEPCAVAAFWLPRTHRKLGAYCSHCCINQMPQIRHIRYRNSVALSSLIVQITDKKLISDINIGLSLILQHHHAATGTLLSHKPFDVSCVTSH